VTNGITINSIHSESIQALFFKPWSSCDSCVVILVVFFFVLPL
jgi:hypothetical protein